MTSGTLGPERVSHCPGPRAGRPGGSVTFIILGWGSCPGAPGSALLWHLPRPILSSLLMGEHGPGGRPCVAQPWSLWSLRFLEPLVYGNIALGCCWEREGRRRFTHTQPQVCPLHTTCNMATHAHTPLSAFMQALTPTHPVYPHAHLSPLTPRHCTRFTPTCSLAHAL